MSVVVDNSRDELLTFFGRATLNDEYTLPDENYQQAFARAATAFSGGDEALAQRLYDAVSKQWFAFATPLLTNGGTNRGLPISCFLNYVDDSVCGLAANFTENCFLGTNGGGIGTYWGAVRSVGEKTSKGVETPGVIPFMHVQDSQVMAYHQGATRRGAAATYMDISHPEIHEFIRMRAASGGDVHRKNHTLHHGVCIPDAFMRAVEADADWELVDPHSGNVREITSARKLWILLLQTRLQTGEPFLCFTDTINKRLPQPLKDLGLQVHHTNLCTEITLPTNASRTAVCCLSSLNLAKLDEWWPHRQSLIRDLVTMLDNTLDVFCEKAPPEMYRAVFSAQRERSLGLGTLGFHTLLQRRGIQFDSDEARELNVSIFSEISNVAVDASRSLAAERGEPEELQGWGRRNAHVLAIAPNATSSIICGEVSPSIGPFTENAFVKKTKAGNFEVRNPVLAELLASLGQDTPEVWRSIVLSDGSVQHLDFLTPEQKALFRTAPELPQEALLQRAIERQPFICQAQSVDIYLHPSVPAKVLHNLHMQAWKGELKTLYYLYSSSVKSTKTGATPQDLAAACRLDDPNCKSCEG